MQAGDDRPNEPILAVLAPAIPIVLPAPPDAILNVLPGENEEAANRVYEEVARVLPDVNKEWILQRAGHGVEQLINTIFDNYDRVPMDPKFSQEHNLNSSMANENDLTFEEPITDAEEEKKSLIAEALKNFLLQRKTGHCYNLKPKIVDFLKAKYLNVKCTTFTRITSKDPVVIFALCELINIKKLDKTLAQELGVGYIWERSIPWLENARKPYPNQYKLDQMYQKDFEEIKDIIETAIKVTLYPCSVCYDEYSIKHIVSCGGSSEESIIANDDQDNHFICHSCMRQHAAALCTEGKLAEGGQGLLCVDPSCGKTILWARVKGILDKEVRHQLGKRIDNEALLDLEGLESCKRCSFAMLFDVSVEENKVFVCAKCKAQFCRICKYDWKDHMGRKCEEMKKVEDIKEEQRKKLEEELTAAIMRTCHRCKLVFSKSEGCNKMTCRCGATQCYVCRKKDINYNHFCQHARDPKIPGCPEQCTGCLLWAKEEEVNNAALDVVRQRALVDRNLNEHIKKL